MKLANFTDPQKCPYGVKGALRRVKNDQNFLAKIYIKSIISQNRCQKRGARISEDSLGPKFMIPQIWGSAEISTARGDILKLWGCGSKNFQKFQIFKNLKKHHFSTFVVFLLLWGQSGLSCSHLPNFVSQKFLRA